MAQRGGRLVGEPEPVARITLRDRRGRAGQDPESVKHVNDVTTGRVITERSHEAVPSDRLNVTRVTRNWGQS